MPPDSRSTSSPSSFGTSSVGPSGGRSPAGGTPRSVAARVIGSSGRAVSPSRPAAPRPHAEMARSISGPSPGANPRITCWAPASTKVRASPSARRRSSAEAPQLTWAANVNPARVAADRLQRSEHRVPLLDEVADLPRPVAGHQPPAPGACRQRQPPPLLAAEEDGRAAAGSGSRVVDRVAHRVVADRESVTPGAARASSEKSARMQVDRRLEAVDPLADGRQRDPEGRVLPLVPTRADPDDEPAPGDVIHDGRRLGRPGPGDGTCSRGPRARAACPGRGARAPP